MAAIDIIASHLNDIRVPNSNARVYKDECVLSFDTPETEGGLYVSLKTFLGFGRDYVELYHQQTGNSVFLHIVRTKRKILPDPKGDGPEKKITRLAIGVEGGFDPDFGKKKFEYEESYSLVVMPGFVSVPWPNDSLPDIVRSSVVAVLEARSAAKLAEMEALAGTWDGEARTVTKHANSLPQLDNGRRIPPSGWKCERCDMAQNLWLNLTDGSILCGRKFYDGSGGNDHAVHHYKNTGFPLAVKLGTITKDGKADVYSYDEDDMVEDPNLIQHLAHFGINIANMEKTEKSMVELELDLNQKYGEWALMQEDGSKLRPLYGPGYTGLANLGNSCYLNSVMQVVFTVPDFQTRFVEKAPEIFSALPADPPSDFNVQMAKLGVGLLSGRYSRPPPEGEEADDDRNGISPRMFKALIGRGHPDFSTKSQQDAQEFFLHLVNVLERNSRHQSNPSECFKFRVEDRFQCGESKKVKYTYRTEYSLPLPIPLEAAVNKDEVAAYEKSAEKDRERVVRPRVTLASCLEVFSRADVVEQFYSTAINGKTTARKTTRLATFPEYLLIHLKKFTLREDWTPAKLDVAVEMPDTLDLGALRGPGPQPGEEPLPEQAAGGPPPSLPALDPALLRELAGMGFPPESCKKAAYFAGDRGVDAATAWLMEHVADSDFADPFVPPGVDLKKPGFVPDEEALAAIVSMGFTRPQATKALKATGNNVERAADWIFSHQAELDAEEEEAPREPEFRDGSSVYQLVAFISHMGTSTSVGHYVCHILRDGRWVIYNDEKVALSENPPKELAYLYLYKRL
ncbi:ubiquitin carboxyl-terminal hydrolase 5 [Bacillus rossius redtenbacheri]|uniref:ubiquitin carboxyl-terminal hydrolase 5 n=1 Tax=Bacillus rossius redtenbacheri TaxID=93214 RepID=UPI002FDDD380